MHSLNKVKNSLIPFVEIAESTSFVEATKVAVRHHLEDALTTQQNWKEMNAGQKLAFTGKTIVKEFSRRFDYGVNIVKSGLDLIVSLIKAIATSVLSLATKSVNPKKHWHHTGIALFTLFSSIAGTFVPFVGKGSHLLFALTILKVNGENAKDKIKNLVKISEETFNQTQETFKGKIEEIN